MLFFLGSWWDQVSLDLGYEGDGGLGISPQTPVPAASERTLRTHTPDSADTLGAQHLPATSLWAKLRCYPPVLQLWW